MGSAASLQEKNEGLKPLVENHEGDTVNKKELAQKIADDGGNEFDQEGALKELEQLFGELEEIAKAELLGKITPAEAEIRREEVDTQIEEVKEEAAAAAKEDTAEAPAEAAPAEEAAA